MEFTEILQVIGLLLGCTCVACGGSLLLFDRYCGPTLQRLWNTETAAGLTSSRGFDRFMVVMILILSGDVAVTVGWFDWSVDHPTSSLIRSLGLTLALNLLMGHLLVGRYVRYRRGGHFRPRPVRHWRSS